MRACRCGSKSLSASCCWSSRRPAAGTSTRIPTVVGPGARNARRAGRPQAAAQRRAAAEPHSRADRGGGAVNVVTAPVETDEGGETRDGARHRQGGALGHALPAGHRHRDRDPVQAGRAGRRPARRWSGSRTTSSRSRSTARGSRSQQARRDARARRRRSPKSKTISDVALSDAETAAQLAEIEVRTAEIAAAPAQRRRRPSPASPA